MPERSRIVVPAGPPRGVITRREMRADTAFERRLPLQGAPNSTAGQERA